MLKKKLSSDTSIFEVLLCLINNFSSFTLIYVWWREFDFSSYLFKSLSVRPQYIRSIMTFSLKPYMQCPLASNQYQVLWLELFRRRSLQTFLFHKLFCIWVNNWALKGESVIVLASDSQIQEGHVWFTSVPYNPSLINNNALFGSDMILYYFCSRNPSVIFKDTFLLDKAVKGTVVNCACNFVFFLLFLNLLR